MLIQVAAIRSATLIGRIHSSVAWPLVGFSATALYLAVVSLEPALRAPEDASA